MFDEKKLSTYRPIPFWTWNDRLELEKLREQIRWMHKNGLGGFFMHARGGLKTEYMSEEWMKCVEACCQEANELGMQAWVYDENGFPSGFAGGKLLEEQENHDQYILAEIGPCDEEANVVHQLKGGEYLNLYIKYSVSTVDILNPNIVEQFMDETHRKYQKHFGEAFSNHIKGFFTDEPQYFRWHTPYTPMAVSYFEEQYGENLMEKLHLLFVEEEGYRTFRYRYWKMMQQLMLDHYSAKVYQWCDSHGVGLTGHYIEESCIGTQLWCCGGVMPFYEYEHIPAIDWLGNVTENELPARQLGSVARQLGKKQTLTETFAACGWDITPRELRRVVGFQFAGGVNMICHHLVPYSERGVRKGDYPVHFSNINPWVKEHFGEFNEYMTKLGYLLGEGKEVVNVAILHPIRSAYFDYKREEAGNSFCISELEGRLRNACRMLSSRGIAYHFLDETLLAKYGFTEGNQIGCGQCAYTYLILPSLLTMDSKTEVLLRNYVMAGGKVLILGEKPQCLEGETYSYDYLQSNCSLEEIVEAQPFSVGNYDTEIYSTYCEMDDGEPFLFLQNASDSKSYTQTFRFSGQIRSFEALDLLTMQTRQLPLTITMAASETLLLFPSEADMEVRQEPREVEFRFENAEVSFEENWLPVDMVRYSMDGIHYSESMYYKQAFARLLEARYEGKLYLQYEFEIETLPEHICILAEEDQMKGSLNGQPLVFREETDSEFYRADIAHMVRLGQNVYETVMDWHQSEKTYYALFGEGVTESLKNCIAYDSEMEAVYLAGDFGVYSHEKMESLDADTVCGRRFYIGKTPDRISELVTDGMPFFRGKFTVCKELECFDEEVNGSRKTWLELGGRYQAAKVEVNGQEIGELLFERKLDISKAIKRGKNQVKVTYTVGNRNLFGPFHFAGNESFTGPFHFEHNDFVREDDSVTGYKLYRFFAET